MKLVGGKQENVETVPRESEVKLWICFCLFVGEFRFILFLDPGNFLNKLDVNLEHQACEQEDE